MADDARGVMRNMASVDPAHEEEYGVFLRAETEKWAGVAKVAGIPKM